MDGQNDSKLIENTRKSSIVNHFDCISYILYHYVYPTLSLLLNKTVQTELYAQACYTFVRYMGCRSWMKLVEFILGSLRNELVEARIDHSSILLMHLAASEDSGHGTFTLCSTRTMEAV